MATVTVYTAERMAEIEAATIVSGEVVGGNLILTRFDSEQIDAGPINPDPAPSVTGSRGGNAALASLLTALANKNIIENNTTA